MSIRMWFHQNNRLDSSCLTYSNIVFVYSFIIETLFGSFAAMPYIHVTIKVYGIMWNEKRNNLFAVKKNCSI